MRALRRVVVIAVAVSALAGCAKFDAALGQQELVVTFQPATSQQAMMKARDACAHLPGATAEAVPTSLNATEGTYDVRYRINQATDAQIAKLEQCLSQFPSVVGVNVEQEGGD